MTQKMEKLKSSRYYGLLLLAVMLLSPAALALAVLLSYLAKTAYMGVYMYALIRHPQSTNT